MAVRCQGCGSLFLPPRPLCPRCHSTTMEWVECSGRGTLAGYSVVYAGLPAMIARGYDRSHPYVAGIVHLEEGPLLNAQILGVNNTHPEDIRVGMQVSQAFIDTVEADTARQSLVFVIA